MDVLLTMYVSGLMCMGQRLDLLGGGIRVTHP